MFVVEYFTTGDITIERSGMTNVGVSLYSGTDKSLFDTINVWLRTGNIKSAFGPRFIGASS